jgi:hypothetical protein
MRKITSENYFLFWQKWLFYSSLVFAFAGIVFALYGNNILFVPYNSMLAEVFWQRSEFPPQADRFRAFIYGPLVWYYCLLLHLVGFYCTLCFQKQTGLGAQCNYTGIHPLGHY